MCPGLGPIQSGIGGELVYDNQQDVGSRLQPLDGDMEDGDACLGDGHETWGLRVFRGFQG